MDPHALEEILMASKYKVMYTIPSAGNPSGATSTLERKKRIYQLAQKHQLLILEDDPYYYLQFDQRIQSYFSMDTDGRVLRFDSLSKTLSAGLRLGWVTGPKPLIERITYHQQSTNLHASGISQLIASCLLEKWGVDGFYAHIASICEFYKEKRNQFLELAQIHLAPVADWNPPSGGMFVWIRLKTIKDSKELIASKAKEKKVLLLPGIEFFIPNSPPTNYVRASYSTASKEQMDLALQRLREVIDTANSK
jgi:kynurenine/2-aminoadipate aminotransferase